MCLIICVHPPVYVYMCLYCTCTCTVGPSTSLLAGVGGASYMPGEGLYQLPNISMEVGGDFDDGEVRGHGHLAAGYEVDELEQEVKCLPPSKRAKLMAGVSVVPSGQVRRNEGGKGRERFRQKKPGTMITPMHRQYHCTLLK